MTRSGELQAERAALAARADERDLHRLFRLRAEGRLRHQRRRQRRQNEFTASGVVEKRASSVSNATEGHQGSKITKKTKISSCSFEAS